jgi:hypothetical protein
MNRAEHVHAIARLEALAAEASSRAAKLREDLATQAATEWTEQGAAPTWRMPDVGTVTLPVSKTAPVVDSAPHLAAWVADRWPTEVEPVVRPAFMTALKGRLVCEGGVVVDAETAEIVPGMGVRAGGNRAVCRSAWSRP